MRSIRCIASCIGVIVFATVTSGCASIVSGTDQHMSFQTNPSGATCEIFAHNHRIAGPFVTPKQIEISKSKNDLSISCHKRGYQDGQWIIESEFQTLSLSIVSIWIAPIGLLVDAITGAMWRYPRNVHFPLILVHDTPPVTS